MLSTSSVRSFAHFYFYNAIGVIIAAQRRTRNIWIFLLSFAFDSQFGWSPPSRTIHLMWQFLDGKIVEMRFPAPESSTFESNWNSIKWAIWWCGMCMRARFKYKLNYMASSKLTEHSPDHFVYSHCSVLCTRVNFSGDDSIRRIFSLFFYAVLLCIALGGN